MEFYIVVIHVLPRQSQFKALKEATKLFTMVNSLLKMKISHDSYRNFIFLYYYQIYTSISIMPKIMPP